MLIKCEECGAEVSDKASACVHCGCPITAVSQEGKVIVYGLSQMNLIGGALKIFANGKFIGKVKKHDVFEYPIMEDTEISVKCGVNPSKGAITAKAGRVTKIKYDFNRLTGCLVPQIVDEVVNRTVF